MPLIGGVGLQQVADVVPSTETAAALFPPKLMGPTWRKDADGNFVLPERTLGWQMLGWCTANLVNPDTREPWVFTNEQARFLLWWYELDERGVRVYNKGVLQRLKGWGKDPLAAIMSIFEAFGPCVFDRFDDEVAGGVVGRRNHQGWVQVAAVSEDQTKNTMLLIPGMMTKAFIAEYELEVMKTMIHAKGNPGNRIEQVTSSASTVEGNRPTFAIANEIHHWVPSRGGPDYYNTLYRNVEKRSGTLLAITNSYRPGEGSVLELERQAEVDVIEGRASFAGRLYDSLEAHEKAPMTLDWAPHIVSTVRGDAVWLDVERISTGMQDTSVPAEDLRRFWYNQVVSSSNALFTESELDNATVIGAELRHGDRVALGFDGGRKDDATALVALRVEDRIAFTIKVWEKPPQDEGWQVPVHEVLSAVEKCFRDLDVVSFFADVALWESYVNQWSIEHGEKLKVRATADSAVGFDMRGSQKKITMANQALISEVRSGRTRLGPSAVLRRHMLNTRRRDNRFGFTFGKEDRRSKNKVDAYAALLLAWMACQAFLERSPAERPEKMGGTFYGF